MHSNYVCSLFTTEAGHGMRSSLRKECIGEGCVCVCVCRCTVYLCVHSIQGRPALLTNCLHVCKRKKETARVCVGTQRSK